MARKKASRPTRVKGTSTVVSAPVLTPPRFLYTLIYRKDKPNWYSPVDPDYSWTFKWDGSAGSVKRDDEYTLTYWLMYPGKAESGEAVWFYYFAESPLSHAQIRIWALEVEPRPHLKNRPDLLCTVTYSFDLNQWVEMGLATKV